MNQIKEQACIESDDARVQVRRHALILEGAKREVNSATKLTASANSKKVNKQTESQISKRTAIQSRTQSRQQSDRIALSESNQNQT